MQNSTGKPFVGNNGNLFNNVTVPLFQVSTEESLSLEQMKLLDNLALSKYHLPIELMMENAGYLLAHLVRSVLGEGSVFVGCGTGNNGGGGLVAARRLLGWGYDVYIDLPNPKLQDLPKAQLLRALSFGARLDKPTNPDLAIDAYFGFSFRTPMPILFRKSITWMNSLQCPIISLDLPSGLTDTTDVTDYVGVNPDAICTLAAPKKILLEMHSDCRLFVADIGIPRGAYDDLRLPNIEGFERASIYAINLTE